jgi:hypothetical protein
MEVVQVSDASTQLAPEQSEIWGSSHPKCLTDNAVPATHGWTTTAKVNRKFKSAQKVNPRIPVKLNGNRLLFTDLFSGSDNWIYGAAEPNSFASRASYSMFSIEI